MAYEIVEKKRFVTKLVKLLEYLETEWGYNVAAKFQSNIDKHLALLSNQPYMGITTSKQNVRSVLVTNHNRLFYKISGNRVIILNMYDTRIDAKKNPYNRK